MIYFGKDPHYNYEFLLVSRADHNMVYACCSEGHEAEKLYELADNKEDLIILHDIFTVHKEAKA